ncbi:MAG TPA: fructose-bisphosphate aldolase class II [Planctomycetes bacterium]|nr:fructose-bisphosphate aldolase class II [Planctomycetota bacterium]
MPLVPMKQLLDEAVKGNYGVGAYNVNNMEQVQAIVWAARDTQSPLIVQASRGALKYSSLVYLKHLMLAAVEENPDLPIAMHLDHGNNLDSCKTAISLGFTSVMIDGSLMEDGKTASDYEYNVKVTKEVVNYAHERGVTVEGELGTLGGIEDGVGSGEIHVTDPAMVQDFVEKTGVDALAVAIGTSHGAYKFKSEPKLAFDVLEETGKRLPGFPLVMHGSSSVPAELVAVVNKYGGKMPDAKGVPMDAIKKGITMGVRKINVDTDSRIAMTGAIRKVFGETPDKFDPRDYLKPAREAVYNLLITKMKDFGTAGHAKDFAPKSLDDYRQLYAKKDRK